MTRECAEDFSAIHDYIDEYAISKNLREESYVLSLKVIHRYYFSAITWHSELSHSKGRFLKMYKDCNDDIVLRLREVVSDLGSCFFNWINGNYKASKIMLRVCIENFIRAISAVEEKSQLTEKNVYQLFDMASSQSIFESCKHCYDSLHSDYKILCADIHTAALQNMAHLTSLADLPAFEKGKSESAESIVIRVCSNITSIFCIVFNLFYHSMHHRNKENVINGVIRSNKPLISGLKSY